MDYDPFIRGQDFNPESIKNSIKIIPLKNIHEYKVCFSLFGRKNEENTEIEIQLINDNGKYFINSILNDKFLNFK